MRSLPPEPRPGEKVSASLIRDIIREMKARTPLESQDMKLLSGPNGFTFIPKKTKQQKSETKDNGCFKIVPYSEEEQEEGESEEQNHKLSFGNRYYSVGGKTYEVASGDPLEVTYPCLVYLKINATESPGVYIESTASMSALQSEQGDTDYYCIPLYSFDENGDLTCDFRNMPTAAMGEF